MIEFEHTIFILLLFTGILNAKPPRRILATVIVLIGVLLVFLPPSQTIPIPWNLILGLVIPLLLWQNVRRIVNADWRGWKSVALWLIAGVIISLALWLGGALNLPSSLLFGMIAASMIWRACEPEVGASYMSQVGPLTLIFLLTEVEIAVQTPDHYIGGIFSGAFFGMIAAFIGLYYVKKMPREYHSWIGIGQVYIAYWLSYFGGVSAVTAAMVSVMTFVWLNQYYKLGFHETPPLAPLNTWPGFGIVLVLFLLLGWQGHQPVSTLFILEVAIVAIIGIGIAWVGSKWKIPAFQNQSVFLMAGLRAALLLFPALLLWPRDSLQDPLQLAVAIGTAVLVLGMIYLGLVFYFPDTKGP